MSRDRSKARTRAVQAVYQWQMTGANLRDIEEHFLEGQDMKGVDMEYFRELLHGVPAHIGALDDHLRPYLDRDIQSVDPVERAILRIGVYEMAHRIDIPWRVVLNEAIEQAKRFGAEHGHKYVNSLLDRTARDLRPVEVAAWERERAGG